MPITVINSNLLTSTLNNAPYCYVDPQNPGTIKNPNCAGYDGIGETASAGGLLSHIQMRANMTIEYAPGEKHFAYGLSLTNIFDQLYGVPYPNPNYKPISTGFGDGVTSGLYAPGSYASSPFLLLPNKPPFNARFYVQFQP